MSVRFFMYTDKFCDGNPECRPSGCEHCPVTDLIFDDMKKEFEKKEEENNECIRDAE